MGNSHVMPKVDFEKENLKKAQVYSRYMEAKNLERYSTIKDQVFKKRVTFACTVIAVVGIYSYTILRLKQETFLDDFEEPVRVANK